MFYNRSSNSERDQASRTLSEYIKPWPDRLAMRGVVYQNGYQIKATLQEQAFGIRFTGYRGWTIHVNSDFSCQSIGLTHSRFSQAQELWSEHWPDRIPSSPLLFSFVFAMTDDECSAPLKLVSPKTPSLTTSDLNIVQATQNCKTFNYPSTEWCSSPFT
eukprot:sb/3472961/